LSDSLQSPPNVASRGADAIRDSKRTEEVLDAARRLFYAKGYDATSVRDIADDLGLLKGSLYYYFGAKEDLLYRLIEDIHVSLFDCVERAVRECDTPHAKMLAFIDQHTVFLANNIMDIAIFFNDFRKLTGERRSSILAARRRYEQILIEIIREGQDSGSFIAERDSTVAALAILGLLNWTHQWYKEDGPLSAQMIAEEFASLITFGLVKR
jgi:AcrR family transcriptional regulator